MALRPSICFTGTHDPAFARNALVAEGLRRRGFAVSSAVVPSWGSTADRMGVARRGLANPALAGRLALAYARLHRQLALQPNADILYLGHPGQLDTIALRLLAPRRTLVLDAFISIDETLADRRVGAADSASRRVARILDRTALRLADLIVVDTAAHRRRFVTEYGLDHRRAVVVPVGAMDTWQAPPSSQSEKTPEGGRPVLRVLYFGGFIPLHGVPVILDAARLLSPDMGIEIELVGDGQDLGLVEENLTAAPLPHVRLRKTWMSERQLIADFVTRADVCLGAFADAPKTMDVVPSKIYLAMACGRPVITADTPAVREELLSRASGGPPLLTCPAGDPGALAESLVRLRDAPALRAALGAAGRALYDRFFRPELIVEPLIPALEGRG